MTVVDAPVFMYLCISQVLFVPCLPSHVYQAA